MKKPKRKKRKTHPWTGQVQDAKGRWMSKPGSKSNAPIPSNASVMEILASRADVGRIARVLERRAYGGDAGAMELLLKAAELQKQQQPPSSTALDLARFTIGELDLMRILACKRENESLSSDERIRAALEFVAEELGNTGAGVTFQAAQVIAMLKPPPPRPATVQEPLPEEEPEPKPEAPIERPQITVRTNVVPIRDDLGVRELHRPATLGIHDNNDSYADLLRRHAQQRKDIQ